MCCNIADVYRGLLGSCRMIAFIFCCDFNFQPGSIGEENS